MNRVLKRRLKYDLINKFNYQKVSELPDIKKINLSFSFKALEYNLLISSFLRLS